MSPIDAMMMTFLHPTLDANTLANGMPRTAPSPRQSKMVPKVLVSASNLSFAYGTNGAQLDNAKPAIKNESFEAIFPRWI